MVVGGVDDICGGGGNSSSCSGGADDVVAPFAAPIVGVDGQHYFDAVGDVTEIATKEGVAYVIDSSIQEDILEEIDTIRLSLPLNSKRPTVDRRFYVDRNKDRTAGADDASDEGDTSTNASSNCFSICKLLERTIQQAILSSSQSQQDNNKRCDSTTASSRNDNNGDSSSKLDDDLGGGTGVTGVFVIKYLRFLEYTRLGTQKLDIHTDGCKVCEDTGYQSTHTLLLYLTTCCAPVNVDDDSGGTCCSSGETILYDKMQKEDLVVAEQQQAPQQPSQQDYVTIYKTKPLRGRILLFPHRVPHSGQPLLHETSLPKICLRAEVCLFQL